MLTVSDLVVAYGPIQALKRVSIHVGQGEVVALLGANGAGKTSLLRAISGLVPASAGSIVFDGKPLDRIPAQRRVGLGLSHCPEGRHVFPDLTVSENLDMGAYSIGDPAVRRKNLDRALHYFPILAERRSQKAGTLSGGEQQMLALGRALMSSPKLLMLDEPSLGLAPMLVDQVFDIVRQINREQGTTILLIEQNANEALLHADRGYVLETGRITLEGPAEELRRNPHVIAAYLGK
jgi:branched-chain amino acid transport system ATP-binding protein